jgi:hypothetical protein
MTTKTRNRPFKIPHVVRHGAAACGEEYVLSGFLLAVHMEIEKPLKPNSLPRTARGLAERNSSAVGVSKQKKLKFQQESTETNKGWAFKGA